MGKFCLYADECKDAPCITAKMRKYSYLKEFLANTWTGNERAYTIPMRIQCLKPEFGSLKVQDPRCINCMFCVFGCVGNRILISKTYHPEELCVDISREQIAELREYFIPRLFKGSFIKLPKVPMSQIKVQYKSFEAFTGIHETENIAVWGANAMKYLSSSMEPRVSLEVGLIIQERDRGGRLDISLYNTKDEYLFVAETKISFSSMMSEGRYETQMMGYETELQKTCPSNLRRAKFLLIGENESDLLPFGHPNCTGGSYSKLFYDVCKEHGFFFMSANAMLALGIMKMFVSTDAYSLENLYPIMTNREYIGLLSSGVVFKDGSIHPFEDIPGFYGETE